MVLFYSGIAGKRNGPILGVVPHNDAGSQAATSEFYRNWLRSHDAYNGFAHVYIGSDGKYQAESFENMAWHTANANGNANYIGWEICQSMGDEATFKANEQAVFKDIAEFMSARNMVPNRTTVMLHQEFSSTSCPHRSWALHGKTVNAVKDYYIQEIKKYMNSGSNNNIEKKTSKIKGDMIMYLLEVVKKKGNNEVWFIDGANRSWLPDKQDVKDVQYLLESKGLDSGLTKFSEDNRTLKNLFKKKIEVKY